MSSQSNRFSRRFLGFRLAEADIRLIRIYCVVARSGGFTPAQSELQMSISAISRAVSSLEARLGVTLCRRGRAGFMLTELGETLLVLGTELLEDLDRFERDIRHLNLRASGRLRVALIDGLLTDPKRRVETFISRFRDHFPGVDLDLTLGRPSEIEMGVAEGQFDFGILFNRSQRPWDFRRLSLYQESANLYCDASHPLATGAHEPAELADYDYAGYSYAKGRSGDAGAEYLRRGASAGQVEAQALLIASGRYFGYLPDDYVTGTVRLQGAVRLFPEIFRQQSDIELIALKDRAGPLVDSVFELAGELVAQWSGGDGAE